MTSMSVMQRFALLKGFNWKVLLIRFVVNVLALGITVLVVPKVSFVDRQFGTVTLLALGLSILNVLIKPILQFLTLNFIFVTYGFIVILINTLVLYLLTFVSGGRFAIDSFFWAVVAATLLGLLSSAFENLLGATLPIIPENYGDLRKQLQKEVPTTAQIVETLVEAPTTLAPAETEAEPMPVTVAAADAVSAEAAAPADMAEPAATEAPPPARAAGG